MFRNRLTLKRPARAQVAHLRAATEVALLVAALAFVGVLSMHPVGREPSDARACVYLGRAGAICDARKPDAEQNCQHFGRAGRFCLPPGR